MTALQHFKWLLALNGVFQAHGRALQQKAKPMIELKKTNRRSTPKQALEALEQAYEYYSAPKRPNEIRNSYADFFTDLPTAA